MKKLFLMVVSFSLVTSALPSSAAVIGRGVKSQIVNTSSWGVSLVNQSGVVVNQDYLINFSSTSGTSYDYFTFRNTGTLTTNTFTVSIIPDVQKNKNLVPADVIFERCDGSWNLSTNACSVTPVQVATGASTSFAVTNALAVGGVLQFRARTPNNNRSIAISLRVQVPRSSVRSGQVVNS